MTDPAKLRERLAAVRKQLYEVVDRTKRCSASRPSPRRSSTSQNELVGVIAVVGTTQHVRNPVEPQQLLNVRACAKAISLKLNSTAYEGPRHSKFARVHFRLNT